MNPHLQFCRGLLGQAVALAVVWAALFGCAATPASPPAIREIELTCIDPQVTGYAVFQSHNQKVLANQHGIFATYNRTRNEKYTAQNWRLMRSVDDGKTFTLVYEETSATNPPVLETDDSGNLYLFRSDDVSNSARLYRFLAADNFSKPLITVIPGAGAGKFSAAIDLPRKQLYYFSHNEKFNVLSLDGKILRSTRLFQPGRDAYLQYPQLFLDHDGTLHAAWTTQKKDVYLYWDIHHMLSPDGGVTWKNLDGAPITPPVVADQTGPATRITRDDEFESHTWLSSFMALNGKLHFAYLAQTKPARMHYARFDIASVKQDVDLWPDFKGETLNMLSLDGFFAARTGVPGSPLFCTMHQKGNLACLVSRDNGATWHDYAFNSQKFNPYCIGGSRAITKDGYIIGTFTDQVGTPADLVPQSKLYFFKIKAK